MSITRSGLRNYKARAMANYLKTLLPATLALLAATAGSSTAIGAEEPALRGLAVTDCKVQTGLGNWQHPGSCLGITVHIKNTSSQAYILDGDRARASGTSGAQTPISERGVVAATRPILSPTKTATVAGVEVGTVGFWGPITYDALTKSKDPTMKYGVNEARRKVELTRLGKRVLLPNEEADATIYVPSSLGVPERIAIPVATHPDQHDAGTLLVEPGKSTGSR
jgi:hypothetical protein